jgi:protein-disulfide isomerase
MAAGVLVAVLVGGAIRGDILQNATLDAANDRLIHWYQSARARTFANSKGIQLTIFTDYKCPVCRFLIPRFERAARAAGAGLVHVAIKDYPLDAECNDQIPAGMKAPHPGACAAAIAAKIVERARNGAAQTFVGWLYANQAVLTKQMIRDHLATEGLIAEYEAMQAYGLDSVRADVSEAGRLGVYSTPALVLNGVTLPNLNAAGLEVLLRYEVSRPELR